MAQSSFTEMREPALGECAVQQGGESHGQVSHSCAEPGNGLGQHFWWTELGGVLAHMLSQAGYASVSSEKHLEFFKQVICPNMGPAPTLEQGYRGTLTADGTPIEYSFSFGTRTTVRFSIDPDATSTEDPLMTRNTESLALALSQSEYGVDMTWFHVLSDHFHLPDRVENSQELLRQAGHNSQVMFGFDLERDGAITAKVYFLPCLNAILRGQTRWNTVRSAVGQLAQNPQATAAGLDTQLRKLETSLARYPLEIEEYVRYLSVDLVNPQTARVKTYVRCPGTTFDQVWDFFTLHQQIEYSSANRNSIQELFTTLRPASQTENSNSNQVSAEPFKKSTICYFVLRQGQLVPEPKLFIAVQKDVVKNDFEVSSAITQWLHLRDEWGYETFLTDAFPDQMSQDNVSVHAWLGVSIKKGRLTLESYLTPDMYQSLERNSVG